MKRLSVLPTARSAATCLQQSDFNRIEVYRCRTDVCSDPRQRRSDRSSRDQRSRRQPSGQGHPGQLVPARGGLQPRTRRRAEYQRAATAEAHWLFTFTQEFPIGSQTHQFSYTLPFADLRNGQRATGLGDLLLNYRPQVLYESDATPAIAPRFSLILPTGSERRGLGNGSFGFQSYVAVSKVVSDRVTLHANAGVTTLFNVQGRTPLSFNLGGSATYAV